MINFCTLFDSNYLTRGLALYRSLERVSPAFHLYVVTFDDQSFEYLSSLRLESLTPISLKEFEDQELLKVKPTRSVAEYCWTCTPSIILYCIQKYHLPSCTYVDADMIFYNDPQLLLDEMDGESVLITSHRFTSEYDQTDHGIYCVQFMFFKNDRDGLTVLNWWRQKCIEWCYARLEDGKFGDQKYLDDWPIRFKGVHVLEQPGGGVAPWNVQQYEFHYEEKVLKLRYQKAGASFPVVFFHFHGMKIYTDNAFACTGTLYDLDETVKEIFYFPYAEELSKIASTIPETYVKIKKQGAKDHSPSRKKLLLSYLRERLVLMWLGKSGPFNRNNFNFKRHYHIHHFSKK
ncbi:MAG: glycosyl transferase [Bacteroidetes bacterium]|nr:MAG: glycosyl transferase [Bacteroidota bacterium]